MALLATIVLLVLLALVVRFLVVRARMASRGAVFDQIDAALRHGRFREAADLAYEALGTYQDPEARLSLRCRLARALTSLEEYATAERLCTDAAEDAADPAGAAEAEIERARCLAAVGEFESATELLRKSEIAGLSDRVATRRDLVEADIALSRLRFDDAERALARAFTSGETGGTSEEAALGHARLQYLKGNFGQAAAEIQRVLEHLQGDDLQAQALFVLARTLLDQERPEPVEADRSIARALIIAQYPGVRAIVTGCDGLIQAHFGNRKEALEASAKAPKLTASKRYAAEAHCLAGDAMRKLDMYAEARSEYQRALGVDEGSLDALWGLGRCAQMQGHYEVAESYFQLCIEAAPEHFLGRRSEDAIET